MNNKPNDIKYILINYHTPNLMTMKAEISFLCNFLDSNYNVLYLWSNKISDISKALVFDTREGADTYIKNMGFENTISYGCMYKELMDTDSSKEWSKEDLDNFRNYLSLNKGVK